MGEGAPRLPVRAARNPSAAGALVRRGLVSARGLRLRAGHGVPSVFVRPGRGIPRVLRPVGRAGRRTRQNGSRAGRGRKPARKADRLYRADQRAGSGALFGKRRGVGAGHVGERKDGGAARALRPCTGAPGAGVAVHARAAALGDEAQAGKAAQPLGDAEARPRDAAVPGGVRDVAGLRAVRREVCAALGRRAHAARARLRAGSPRRADPRRSISLAARILRAALHGDARAARGNPAAARGPEPGGPAPAAGKGKGQRGDRRSGGGLPAAA